MDKFFFWFLVSCGLTSHSAIFQLYIDGTDVQFSNLVLLPGTHAMGSHGSFTCRAYIVTGTGTSEDVFNLLTYHQRARTRWRQPGVEHGSPDLQSSPLPLHHRGGRMGQGITGNATCPLAARKIGQFNYKHDHDHSPSDLFIYLNNNDLLVFIFYLFDFYKTKRRKDLWMQMRTVHVYIFFLSVSYYVDKHFSMSQKEFDSRLP